MSTQTTEREPFVKFKWTHDLVNTLLTIVVQDETRRALVLREPLPPTALSPLPTRSEVFFQVLTELLARTKSNSEWVRDRVRTGYLVVGPGGQWRRGNQWDSSYICPVESKLRTVEGQLRFVVSGAVSVAVAGVAGADVVRDERCGIASDAGVKEDGVAERTSTATTSSSGPSLSFRPPMTLNNIVSVLPLAPAAPTVFSLPFLRWSLRPLAWRQPRSPLPAAHVLPTHSAVEAAPEHSAGDEIDERDAAAVEAALSVEPPNTQLSPSPSLESVCPSPLGDGAVQRGASGGLGLMGLVGIRRPERGYDSDDSSSSSASSSSGDSNLDDSSYVGSCDSDDSDCVDDLPGTSSRLPQRARLRPSSRCTRVKRARAPSPDLPVPSLCRRRASLGYPPPCRPSAPGLASSIPGDAVAVRRSARPVGGEVGRAGGVDGRAGGSRSGLEEREDAPPIPPALTSPPASPILGPAPQPSKVPVIPPAPPSTTSSAAQSGDAPSQPSSADREAAASSHQPAPSRRQSCPIPPHLSGPIPPHIFYNLPKPVARPLIQPALPPPRFDPAPQYTEEAVKLFAELLEDVSRKTGQEEREIRLGLRPRPVQDRYLPPSAVAVAREKARARDLERRQIGLRNGGARLSAERGRQARGLFGEPLRGGSLRAGDREAGITSLSASGSGTSTAQGLAEPRQPFASSSSSASTLPPSRPPLNYGILAPILSRHTNNIAGPSSPSVIVPSSLSRHRTFSFSTLTGAVDTLSTQSTAARRADRVQSTSVELPAPQPGMLVDDPNATVSKAVKIEARDVVAVKREEPDDAIAVKREEVDEDAREVILRQKRAAESPAALPSPVPPLPTISANDPASPQPVQPSAAAKREEADDDVPEVTSRQEQDAESLAALPSPVPPLPTISVNTPAPSPSVQPSVPISPLAAILVVSSPSTTAFSYTMPCHATASSRPAPTSAAEAQSGCKKKKMRWSKEKKRQAAETANKLATGSGKKGGDGRQLGKGKTTDKWMRAPQTKNRKERRLEKAAAVAKQFGLTGLGPSHANTFLSLPSTILPSGQPPSDSNLVFSLSLSSTPKLPPSPLTPPTSSPPLPPSPLTPPTSSAITAITAIPCPGKKQKRKRGQMELEAANPTVNECGESCVKKKKARHLRNRKSFIGQGAGEDKGDARRQP